MPLDPHLAPLEPTVLTPLSFAAAVLYTSVGHTGASGPLAVVSFVGLAPATTRPTALARNVVVEAVAAVRCGYAGPFPRSTLWPLAAGSVPLAGAGWALHLPAPIYRPLVEGILLITAPSCFGASGQRRSRKSPGLPGLSPFCAAGASACCPG